MPRSLVAGGAGFLGSHLVERLLKDGHEVVAVDNLATGQARNLDAARGDRRCLVVQANASDGVPAAAAGRFTHVWHLASPASPPDYQRRAVETMRAGSEATRHLLERAVKDGATFLMASTSEVYGDPEVSPQPETYWGRVNPVGPRSMYDEAKRYAEALTMAFHHEQGADTRIVRIFNTYGPRMRLDDGRVVPNLLGQALRGEPLTVYGDGTQTRSFCYVDDLVDGIVRLAAAKTHEPVNVGNPAEITINEFARRVQELAGRDLPIVHRPLPQDDPRQRRPDIRRARALLGWEPRTDLATGLRKTLDAFRQDLAAARGS